MQDTKLHARDTVKCKREIVIAVCETVSRIPKIKKKQKQKQKKHSCHLQGSVVSLFSLT